MSCLPCTAHLPECPEGRCCVRQVRMCRPRGVGTPRPKKKKPAAVAAAAVADSTSVMELAPPAPPECAPSPPPAPAPAPPAAVPAAVASASLQAQPKKRGRPPDTWLQTEEKKLKKMELAYLSAEADRMAKIEENDRYLDRTYTIDKPWPLSLERRFLEKMQKRQRKIDELQRIWLEAVEAFEAEKQRRAVRAGLDAVRQLKALQQEHRLTVLKYELAELQRQRAEASRAEAAAALQRGADENVRLARENRRLRALLEGEDWKVKTQLDDDLEWCEQYLAENAPEELALAAVRTTAWSEAAARAQMIAASLQRQSRAAMPPPPPRASVVPLSCVGTPRTVWSVCPRCS